MVSTKNMPLYFWWQLCLEVESVSKLKVLDLIAEIEFGRELHFSLNCQMTVIYGLCFAPNFSFYFHKPHRVGTIFGICVNFRHLWIAVFVKTWIFESRRWGSYEGRKTKLKGHELEKCFQVILVKIMSQMQLLCLKKIDDNSW